MRGRGSGSGGGRRGAGEPSRARAAAEPPGEGPRGACRECAGNGSVFPGRLSVSQSRSLLLSPRSWLVFFKATTFVVARVLREGSGSSRGASHRLPKIPFNPANLGEGERKKKKSSAQLTPRSSRCCGRVFTLSASASPAPQQGKGLIRTTPAL